MIAYSRTEPQFVLHHQELTITHYQIMGKSLVDLIHDSRKGRGVPEWAKYIATITNDLGYLVVWTWYSLEFPEGYTL